MPRPRLPAATYRVQLRGGMGFEGVRRLVDYLHRLGITDLYLSPIFAARTGSTHGYDVTDPTRIDATLGGLGGYRRLVRELRRRGMGVLLDIVPNHLAAHEESPWWSDVLRRGPRSRHARVFDIDWNRPRGANRRPRVVLPVLDEEPEEALRRGAFRLVRSREGLHLAYGDRRLPLGSHSDRQLIDAFEASRSGRSVPPRVRAREERLLLDRAVIWANGAAASASGQGLFRRLLSDQFYALTHWRSGLAFINYRRFFDISDLVGVRAEDPEVFAACHRLVARLVRLGLADGLRVDHIDGLAEPGTFLHRLKAIPGSPRPTHGTRSVYVIVEKVLAADEDAPRDWPADGTTGYDFLNDLNAVFVDPRGYTEIADEYARFTGHTSDLAHICREAKMGLQRSTLASDVTALVALLSRIAASSIRHPHLREEDLREALLRVTACLPVYRTYVRRGPVPFRDRKLIEWSVREARKATKEPGEVAALAFLRDVMLGRAPARSTAPLAFVRRWQQFTGATMAKGLEDTAFYRYNPFISLNEVGAGPLGPEARFGVDAFHRRSAARLRRWRATLNATSTHDTKRSEDVRARLNVLSEIPSAWNRKVRAWHRMNRPLMRTVRGRTVPDPNLEVHLYQTLVGAWPLAPGETPGFVERIGTYMIKAAREAKRHTTWLEPDAAYESALLRFVDGLLDSTASPFMSDFLRFERDIAQYGALNSMSQLVLKIASPGVPDFYQGNELWDFSLVDPDNRRPVDFAKRIALLQEMERDARDPGDIVDGLVASLPDGRIKLFLTYRGLNFRRDHASLLREGSYRPLQPQGARADHAVAFVRRRGTSWALAATARGFARLSPPGMFRFGHAAWQDTILPLPTGAPSKWTDVLTGEDVPSLRMSGRRVLPLGTIFRHLPVALLTASANDGGRDARAE